MLPSDLSIIHTRSTEYRNKIIELWNECLPGTPEGRYDWQTEGNPAGPIEWFLAIDNSSDRVVGTGSLMPKELFINGKAIRGGIVGDLMVSPTARKQGVAQSIQKIISDSMNKLEMDFLYVVPNEHSAKLLIKAGINQTFILKNYLLPIEFEYYFKKVGLNKIAKLFAWLFNKMSDVFFIGTGKNGQCTINNICHFNDETNKLWEIIQNTPDRLIGSRSSAYLDWKYCKNPVSNFQTLQYRAPSGTLLGFIIFSISASQLHIYEMLSISSKHHAGMISGLREFAKSHQLVGIYLCTTPTNPVLKSLKWRGLFPIGGDLQILARGEIFSGRHPWAFFTSDRNI